MGEGKECTKMVGIKKKKKIGKDYWITTGWEGEEILVPNTDNPITASIEDDSILDIDIDKYLDSYSDEQIVSEYVKKGK